MAPKSLAGRVVDCPGCGTKVVVTSPTSFDTVPPGSGVTSPSYPVFEGAKGLPDYPLTRSSRRDPTSHEPIERARHGRGELRRGVLGVRSVKDDNDLPGVVLRARLVHGTNLDGEGSQSAGHGRAWRPDGPGGRRARRRGGRSP